MLTFVMCCLCGFSLMLGLMLPTWFLSMWISNTAAASMMLPILVAITEQMEKLERERHGK